MTFANYPRGERVMRSELHSTASNRSKDFVVGAPIFVRSLEPDIGSQHVISVLKIDDGLQRFYIHMEQAAWSLQWHDLFHRIQQHAPTPLVDPNTSDLCIAPIHVGSHRRLCRAIIERLGPDGAATVRAFDYGLTATVHLSELLELPSEFLTACSISAEAENWPTITVGQKYLAKFVGKSWSPRAGQTVFQIELYPNTPPRPGCVKEATLLRTIIIQGVQRDTRCSSVLLPVPRTPAFSRSSQLKLREDRGLISPLPFARLLRAETPQPSGSVGADKEDCGENIDDQDDFLKRGVVSATNGPSLQDQSGSKLKSDDKTSKATQTGADLSARIANFRQAAALDNTKRRVAELEEKLAESEQRDTAMKLSLEGKTTEAETLQLQLQKKSADLEEANEARRRYRLRRNGLLEELKASKNDLNDATRNNETLRTENGTLARKLAESEASYAELLANITEAKETLATLRDEHADTLAQLNAKLTEIADLSGEVLELRDSLMHVVNNEYHVIHAFKPQTDRIAQLTAENGSLTAELESACLRIQELQTALDVAQSEKSNDFADFAAKVSKLSSDKEELVREIRVRKRQDQDAAEALREKISSLNQISSRVQDELSQLQITHAACQRELASVRQAKECSVCLDRYDSAQNRQKLALIPCGHEYCSECVGRVVQVENQRVAALTAFQLLTDGHRPKCPQCRTIFRDSLRLFENS